jgi:ATP-dependent DNA ligase
MTEGSPVQTVSSQPASTAPGEATGARAFLATVRPQIYGTGAPDKVLDPLIEPLWVGIRALAAVDADGATIVDDEGDEVARIETIVEALAGAVRATGLVVDGFLTKQAIQSGLAVYQWSDESPSMGSFIGLRRNRAVDTVALREEALEAKTFKSEDEISFVATDLLWLDDTSLLDVPLLERRRLLESVIEESDVIRVGTFVRPPIGSWVGSWKAQGFTGLTYKAANSRYRSGEANPEWAISGMPRR